MSRPLVRAVQAFAAVLVGVLPGFFLVFNAVFTDATSIWQRLLSFVLVVAGYGVLGWISGYAMPEGRKTLGVAMTLPGAAFLVIATLNAPDRILLHLFLLVLMIVSAYVGAELGTASKIHQKV